MQTHVPVTLLHMIRDNQALPNQLSCLPLHLYMLVAGSVCAPGSTDQAAAVAVEPQVHAGAATRAVGLQAASLREEGAAVDSAGLAAAAAVAKHTQVAASPACPSATAAMDAGRVMSPSEIWWGGQPTPVPSDTPCVSHADSPVPALAGLVRSPGRAN